MTVGAKEGKNRSNLVGRLGRALGLALAVGFAFLLLAGVCLRIALQRPAVQQRVIEGLSEAVEPEFGVSIAAERFDLGFLGGRFEIHGLELRAGAAEPFARIEAARFRFRPLTLVRGPLRLSLLELERPEVNGDAPFPVSKSVPDTKPLESLDLLVDRLRIERGLAHGRAPEPVARFLENWQFANVEAEGRFDGRRLTVSKLTADGRLGSGTRDGAELEVETAASFALSGAVEVDRLSVGGDELSIDASLRLAEDWEESSGSFQITADPGTWLGDGPSGRVKLAADVDLAAWKGSVRFDAIEQPGRLGTEFGLVAPDLASLLELSGTDFDIRMNLDLERSEDGERVVAGDSVAVVRRDRTTVLELDLGPRVRLDGGSLADAFAQPSLDVAADLRLLPGEAGTRAATADFSSADPVRVETWRIERGKAVVEQPSLERLLEVCASLYPRLLAPSTIRNLPRLGALSSAASFGGGLDDLWVDAGARVRPNSGRIDVSAKGRPLSRAWSIDAAGVDLDLGQFTSAASGTVDFSGRAGNLLGAASGSLEVKGREIGTGSGWLFSVLEADLEGTLASLLWRIDGALAGGGSVQSSGRMSPERRQRLAAGTIDWQTGDDRVPRVDASFEVARGTLSATALGEFASAGSAGSDAGSARLEVRLPLGALDALPQWGVLSKLPVERAPGPVIVSWRVPKTEWRDFLPAAWIDKLSAGMSARAGVLEAGSTGDFVLDLTCPTCSSGAAELSDLEVHIAGRRAQSPNHLRIRLAEGEVEIEPWSLIGEGLELELSGQVGLSRKWRPADPVSDVVTDTNLALSAAADSVWLDALPLEISTPGKIAVGAMASGPPDALIGSASLSAPDLSFAMDRFPSMTLTGATAEATLREGIVEWKNARLEVNDALLSTEGQALLEDPFRRTAGTLRIASGWPVLTSATLPFEITDGWLGVEEGRLTTDSGEGALRFDLPIAGGASARARIEWSLPVNDWAPLLQELRGLAEPEVIELASHGKLSLPLDWPAAAEAAIELSAGRIVVRGRETRIEPKLEISVAEGTVHVAPFRLRSVDENFVFEARADLVDEWTTADDPADLIADFRIEGRGDVDSGLLSPFLAGGRAEGGLNLDLEVAGTPSVFSGRVKVTGPDATIVFRSPYLARFENPDFEIAIEDGRVKLERGSLRLNEGVLEGSGTLSEGGRTDLGLRITDSVFRLDYGLVVTLRGDLRYQLDGAGDSTVSGVVSAERGALTRSVQLDLDLLSQLLAPIDLTTTEDDPLDLVALNLEVRTREGVRVKNNLGDLLVRWEPLEVTGTLARPIVEGRLEVDAGGLLYAYGQTVRLDKAVIEYPGEFSVEPRLDFEATTSLEDPTIGQLAGADPFKAVSRTQRQAATSPASQEITADLARYYGERVAGKVGASVGVSVSLRPLLIFGETDPGARLTVSRDLSPNLGLAASIDLTGAEDRIYLLELHELRQLPRLVAQAFTDEGTTYGGALLQRQEWGGSRPDEASDLSRISKIVSAPPKGVSRRGIKRTLGLEKGMVFDPGQRFVTEVEMVDYLMRKGYPDARVSVRAEPDPRKSNRVQLEIEIQPGPKVEFEFEGEKIPDSLKPLIRSLYRPDFFESESIDEVRTATVRALRSRGFLVPEVDVVVDPIGGPGSEGDRRITVRTTGGERISPAPPVFLGLPAEDVEVLNVTFANAVQRVELAVGLPSADRRLLTTLAGLGYPEARVVSRYQSLGERVLTVEIDPGPRERIAGISIEGLDGSSAEIQESEITALLVVAPGDSLRRVGLSRSAIAIERYLGKQGYLDARVRTTLDADPGGDLHVKAVRFVVEPGRISRLESVGFEGLRSTRESFARRVAGLETGKPLAKEDLSRARTSLWKTGLFSGVGAEIMPTESGLERVVLDLEERDRYRLTYGVRWDSEDGMGAVVDATDDNFVGRGWTLGLRLLTSNEEDSLRALTRVPRAFAGPGSLEFFAAIRQFSEVATDLIFGSVEVPVDVFESTLQYSHPLSPRTTFRTYGRYTDTTRALPFFTLQVKNPQLGFQYLYDSRSSEPVVERGIFASIDISGSREFLGGDLAYVRSFSQLNLYRPIGRVFGSRLLWSQSFRIGLAEAFDQVLTRDVRFLAGGEYSVRGYETESLGVQEQFGSVSQAIGGAALLVINQELRWRLFEDYTLVLFADAGNVWPVISDFGSDLFTSTGIGVRAVTPVGLLRLDIARPLQGRLGIDPDYKIYFGLGASF